MNRRSHWIPLCSFVALLLAGCLAPRAAQAASEQCQRGAQISDRSAEEVQGEASRLVDQLPSHAVQVSRSGDTLKAMDRSQLSWQSHAAELDTVRTGVNGIGKLLGRLHAMRVAVSPWQQETMDRIHPAPATLAHRTDSAILTLNENRGRLFATDYSDHVSEIFLHANQIKESTQKSFEIAELRDRLQELEDDLEEQLRLPNTKSVNNER